MFDSQYSMANIMQHIGIRCVLDVGANSGQFGEKLLNRGFQGRLISFEPLTDCFAELSRNAQRHPNWDCHNLAIGSQEGTAVINVSGNRYSSSILPAASWSVEEHAPIGSVAQQPVRVRRLDSLWQELWPLSAPRPLMLKIDVQGFEPQVLEGLGQRLQDVDLLLFEASLIPSYEGAETFEVMVADMRSKGLYPVWIGPGWGSSKTGQIFECDIAFARTPLIR